MGERFPRPLGLGPASGRPWQRLWSSAGHSPQLTRRPREQGRDAEDHCEAACRRNGGTSNRHAKSLALGLAIRTARRLLPYYTSRDPQ